MSKWASYFFSVEGRNYQDADIYDITNPVLLNSLTNSYYVSGTPLTGSLFTPQSHLEVSPRVDLQLGQRNTLTLRYQFFRQNQSGILSGATSLPSLATSSYTNENAFQLMDSQIISESVVNETRLQYRRGTTTSAPVSTAPSFSVPQLFSDGGSGGQNSHDHSDHLELQNITTMTRGRQAIKFGLWARDNRDAESTDAGFNGSIQVSLGRCLCLCLERIEQECRPRIDPVQQRLHGGAGKRHKSEGGCLPNKLSYTTGPLGVAGQRL